MHLKKDYGSLILLDNSASLWRVTCFIMFDDEGAGVFIFQFLRVMKHQFSGIFSLP